MKKRFFIILAAALATLLVTVKLLSYIDKNNTAPKEDIILISENGKEISLNKFNDKPKIVFFGFTNCPAICPAALANISAAFNEMGSDAEKFYGLFITTDPERDNSEVLKSFTSNFTNIQGFTGTSKNLKKVYKRYYVYSQKAEDSTGNYDMNHSTTIYLLNKNGEMVDHFESDIAPEELARKLKDYLNK